VAQLLLLGTEPMAVTETLAEQLRLAAMLQQHHMELAEAARAALYLQAARVETEPVVTY